MEENIKNNDSIEVNDDSIEEKVEYKEKKRFDYSLIFKWVFGVYLLAFLMNVNSHLLKTISNFIHEKVLTDTFMYSEVPRFIEILREPLILLILIAPFFIPMTITLLILNLAIVKFKIFPKTHKIVYLIFATLMLFVIAISVFMFGG